MFKENDVIINADLNSSVVNGTFLTSDLIPAFLNVIKNTVEYSDLNCIPNEAINNPEDTFWSSEDSMYLLEQLFDTLEYYAPIGYYFGSHMGNGSDFGYWTLESED